MDRFCSVAGCGSKHRALGYCIKHHRQFVRTGNPISTVRKGCWVADCKRAHYARGLCKSHYEIRRTKTAA